MSVSILNQAPKFDIKLGSAITKHNKNIFATKRFFKFPACARINEHKLLSKYNPACAGNLVSH